MSTGASELQARKVILLEAGTPLGRMLTALISRAGLTVEPTSAFLEVAVRELAEGALVIDPVPRRGTEHLELMRAAIAGGGALVAASNVDDVALAGLELEEEARSAGATVVPSSGLSPGLTDVLVRLGTDHIEEVAEIGISVVRSSADSRTSGAPFDLLDQLSRRAPYIADHEPASTASAIDPKPVFFPEPLGWVETFRCGHPEIQTIYKKSPGLRALTYRLGVAERAVMDIARITVRAGIVGALANASAPRALTERVLAFLERLPPPGPSASAMRVDVRGRRDGRRDSISLGLAGAAVDLMAIPMAHAATRSASPGAPSGVFTLDQIADTETLFGDLGRAGIRLMRLEAASI